MHPTIIETLSPFEERTLTLTKLNGTYIKRKSRDGELAVEELISKAGCSTLAIVVVEPLAIPEASSANENVASTT